jgi:putative membrane protein
MGPWDGWHMGGGWLAMLLGGLLLILFWIAVIALAFFAVRRIARSGQTSGISGNRVVREVDALEILKQRYARGEISREEYQVMKQDLES